MSFGRNPHVAKAQAAEQKARLAKDNAARKLAWREAARQWDRAAERDNSDARKQDYLEHALAARAQADSELEAGYFAESVPAPADAQDRPAPSTQTDAGPKSSTWLN